MSTEYYNKENHQHSNVNLDLNHSTNTEKGHIPLKTEKNVDVNAENKLVNKTFRGFSKIGALGFSVLAYNYSTYWEQWRDVPENYEYPSLYDFKYILISFFVVLFLKILMEKLTGPFLRFLLHPKYKENEETEAIYLKQMKSSLFKFVWYILIVSLGYTVIVQLEFFPKEMFGNGDLASYYDKGAPYTIFIQKPGYFNLYYLASLGFTFNDFFFLLFVHDKKTDYDLMVLHHIVTITLVSFSYLTNNSNVGIIVFFLHDFTDIFVYLTRLIINTFLPDSVKYAYCAFFLGIFAYFRLYVYGKVIYIHTMHLQTWNVFTYTLTSMLGILYIMHIYWTYSIIKRFFYKKIEDVGKVNKNKANKN